MDVLRENIAKCLNCAAGLPLEPRPIVQLASSSKLLIIGQAPGRKVHETGIPWNDASGKKLREWLGIESEIFYDPNLVSIMPMGFCYPGKGISGDLPPRRECAPLWHSQILSKFDSKPLIILIGQYAQRYYLKQDRSGSLTETVRNYQNYLPDYFPLPHPSPRNQNWLKVNPWFATDVIPQLRRIVSEGLNH